MTTELAKIAFEVCVGHAELSDEIVEECSWENIAPDARKNWREITEAVAQAILKKLGIDIPSIEYLEDLPEGEFLTSEEQSELMECARKLH